MGPRGVVSPSPSTVPVLSWADLQPGHRHGLFGAADGPGYGEGLWEEGRPSTCPCPDSQQQTWPLALVYLMGAAPPTQP